MFITRECDYAVRVIRALLDGRRLSVGEICKKEEITVPFAYKILKKLQVAKIVKGFRGGHRVHSLQKHPRGLPLQQFYQANHSEMFLVECLNPDKHCSRDGAGGMPCQIHQELEDIQRKLLDLLSEKSLEKILEHE